MTCPVYNWANWIGSIFTELLVFIWVTFFIKTVFSERAHITVCLMFALIVDVFESVCARFRFIFFDLKFKWVNFEASITTPYYLSIVFDFVGSVTLNVSRPMYMICKSCVTPLLAILALKDFRVYICFSNGCNVSWNICWWVL